MTGKVIDKINQEALRSDGCEKFAIGDIVDVHVKVREGEKERIQIFKGTVIARDGGSAEETFTVRRVTHGVGVERVFPVHSPGVAKVVVQRSSHVRRAKLYFLRNLAGKKARLRQKMRA